jgi:hypothetical protein
LAFLVIRTRKARMNNWICVNKDYVLDPTYVGSSYLMLRKINLLDRYGEPYSK